jgi:hypothetical protein
MALILSALHRDFQIRYAAMKAPRVDARLFVRRVTVLTSPPP